MLRTSELPPPVAPIRKSEAFRRANGWLFAGLSGCSLATVDYGECNSNGQCSATFGLGSVCSQDGLCAMASVDPRCEKTYPSNLLTSPLEHQNTIVFGALFNRDNETHRARENAIELALSQVNLEGGLQGRRFGVVFCDIAPNEAQNIHSTLEGALEATQYLTTTLAVPALLGPSSSGDVEAVFQAVGDSGTFVISPSATSPALTAADPVRPSDATPGLLWRTAPPDSLQGRVIAEDMRSRNISNVAIVSQQGAYGEGLRQVFAESFSGQFDTTVFNNSNQLSEAIATVGNSDAQEVLFIASAQEDVLTFLTASATNAGFDDKTLFLTDTAATEDIVSRGPPQVFSRIRGSRPTPLTTVDTVNATFVASYTAIYSDDATRFSFTSHAYDMTWIAMLGSAWSVLQEDGPIAGTHIARGARKLSSGEPFPLTPSQWNPMLEQFRAGQSINIRGASGALDYSPEDEETAGPIDIWVIDSASAEPRIVAEPSSE